MGKNIILCSDGTGNKGGYGADSNVFKTYKAVSLNSGQKEQITFYDNGVGTNKNKYLRMISGAFGFGFSKNVTDSYEFLSRNYKPGDDIFLFGFSRGAATVRAFAGMIEECGLLDVEKVKTNNFIDEYLFSELLDKAFKAYRKSKKKPTEADEFKKEWAIADDTYAPGGNLKIKFIGVWDTVSALGFPQDWSVSVQWFFRVIDKLSDYVWPHDFYNYRLNTKVEHVYHALAIDDERKTFHPKVWNEKNSNRPENIEQVWFAGAHSNVGGGYPRSGLSDAALEWMMVRAAHHGIEFNPDALEDISQRANSLGKLFDSRDGAAIYYRYAPRNIKDLCEDKIEGSIKIHQTVFHRMERRIAGYAPGYLPDQFEIVETDINSPPRKISLTNTGPYRKKIDKWVNLRKRLYRIFVETTFIIVATSLYLWNYPLDLTQASKVGIQFSWLTKHIADFLYYFSPEFFDGFINYFMIINPHYFALLVVFLVALYQLRKNWKKKNEAACNEFRKLVLEQL